MVPRWNPAVGNKPMFRYHSAIQQRRTCSCSWSQQRTTLARPAAPVGWHARFSVRHRISLVGLESSLYGPLRIGSGAGRGGTEVVTGAVWLHRRRGTANRAKRFIICAKDDKNVRRGQPNGPWRPWQWLTQKAASLRVQQPARLLFNVVLLFLLMRLWPLGGRNPVGEPAQLVAEVALLSSLHRVPLGARARKL
jgi:hypothetical protein